VEQLDVQAVRVEACELGDTVALLEAQHELRADVVRGLELVEPEREGGGLLPAHVEEACLDVVRAAGVVTLAQLELPLLPRRDPVLERCCKDGERLVDLDVDPLVGPLGGRRSPCASGARVSRKLIVFVPREALDRVRDALFAAGAGRIGDYERCSWYTEGTGTFLGGVGTSPDVGQAGREERVAELRLETVFPADRQDEVIAALRRAHPYEEPAFDIYELLS
jgi:hypothetical protein